MSYTITDYSKQFENNTIQKANLFLRMMAEEMVRTSTPKTPKKSGRMRMDILKSVLGLKGKIVWGKDYAKYQETKQFKNYTTPGTGPHFAENAVMSSIKLTNSIARKVGLI
jgi:hypothetical protein